MENFKHILVIYISLCIFFTTSIKLDESLIQECKRCTVLIDSFEYWLAMTSRGKHEGGDVAWEEAKLKAYARSEVRLVEVQEGLCTEVRRKKDQCYAMYEQFEHLIEKWWFQNNVNNPDLFTWLCVENLQYCCPKHHFGKTCLPCSTDKDNKICSGHGRCDGDGTRTGNGSCICSQSFDGAHCENCAHNFYIDNLLCEPCHQSCDGCSGPGAASCHSCKTGWLEQLGSCVDVDECADILTCESYQYCINNEGSYLCKTCHTACNSCTGPGDQNCISCKESYTMWSGKCIDQKHKDELLKKSFNRIVVYVILLILFLFLLRNSKGVATLIVLLVAIYATLIDKVFQLV